jgi:glycopeptide antibiotics resistance protein
VTTDNRRKLGLALAVFTVLVAIIATQWPFDYHLTRFGVARRWARVDWTWFHHTPQGRISFDRDFALNLAMLIPLGVGFAVWRRAGALRVIAESLLLGAMISVVLEVAQLVTPHRYTALPDVWRNALGCMVGCAFAIWIDRTSRPRDS